MKKTILTKYLLLLLALLTLSCGSGGDEVVKPLAADEILTGWWQIDEVSFIRKTDKKVTKQIYKRGSLKRPYLNYDPIAYNFRKSPYSTYVDSVFSIGVNMVWSKNNTVITLDRYYTNVPKDELLIQSLDATAFKFISRTYYQDDFDNRYMYVDFPAVTDDILFVMKPIK